MCVRVVFFFFLFFVEVCDVGTKRLAVNCGEKTAEEGREKEAALEARKGKKKKKNCTVHFPVQRMEAVFSRESPSPSPKKWVKG